jgi:hypothetical protein
MKCYQVLLAAVFLLFSTSAKAEEVKVDCEFLLFEGEYTCRLNSVVVPDNRNATFVIGGKHLPGGSSFYVKKIVISQTKIPFVITALFSEFQNINEIIINTGGLKRIQSNAFAGALNLEKITIANNWEL